MTAPVPDPEDLVAIGRVLRPHGLRGELRLQVLTDFPERFEDTDEVWLVPPHGPARNLAVEGVRYHTKVLLLKLAGVDDPETAARYRGWLVSVPEDQLVELEPGEFWHFQLEGLEVRDEAGNVLGQLTEVLPTPGHDLYTVRGGDSELLIPAVAEYVRSVNLETGVMVVRPPLFED